MSASSLLFVTRINCPRPCCCFNNYCRDILGECCRIRWLPPPQITRPFEGTYRHTSTLLYSVKIRSWQIRNPNYVGISAIPIPLPHHCHLTNTFLNQIKDLFTYCSTQLELYIVRVGYKIRGVVSNDDDDALLVGQCVLGPASTPCSFNNLTYNFIIAARHISKLIFPQQKPHLICTLEIGILMQKEI